MKPISFFVTQQCNQKCDYCDIPDIKNPRSINLELFDKYANIIIDHYSPTEIRLTGGEIGLLPKDNIDYILTSINSNNIRINTNGLFLERHWDLFEKYKCKLGITYHHIDLNSEILKKYHHNKINCMFVICNDNINNVKKIIDKYNGKIRYCTSIFEPKRKGDISFVISPSKLKEINKLGLSENICVYMDNDCYCSCYCIDFVEGNILECAKSYMYSPRYKLNDENINLLDFKRKRKHFYMCDYCTEKTDKYNLKINRLYNEKEKI